MVIVVSSIPKSGTFYLKKILEFLFKDPDKTFAFQFSPNAVTECEGEVHSHIITTNSHYTVFVYLGHWPYTENCGKLLCQDHFVFLYRHPMDIAVSFVEGAITDKFKDPMAKRLKRFSNREQQYLRFLNGIPSIHHPWARGFDTILQNRIGWLTDKRVFPIKYEDLFFKRNLNPLIQLLGVTNVELEEAIERATNDPVTRTFRKGGCGNWKTEMPESVKGKYLNKIGKYIEVMGYV